MERWLCHNHENGYANVEVLRFQSKRAKRVVHSTLTIETLAATQDLDQNCGTRLRLLEFGFDLDGVLRIPDLFLMARIASQQKYQKSLSPIFSLCVNRLCLGVVHIQMISPVCLPSYGGHLLICKSLVTLQHCKPQL